MRQLPLHRVGRGELVVELAGHHLKQQHVNLKASNSEAQTRNTRAARRSRRRASLADLVGPQKTIPPCRRGGPGCTCGFLHPSMWMSMRSIFAAEAGCSTGSTLLHLLHHVVGAIPLQLFLDLDSDETNGVVLQRDRNRHVRQLPSGRRGQHRQLSPECQRHVGEARAKGGHSAWEAPRRLRIAQS